MASTARDSDAPAEDEEPGREPGRVAQSIRHPRVIALAQIATGIVLFGLVAYAAARDWDDVRDTVSRISPLELVISELLVLAGLGASVMTWRQSLTELGSRVRVRHAAKIYLVGQLGKYVPGSIWAVLLQMELAHKVQVPRSRSFAAGIVAAGVNALTGILIGLLIIPSVDQSDWWRYAVFACLAVACAVALTPPVLTRLVSFGLRLLRRPPLEAPVTWPGMLRAAGWAVASWLAYGLCVWVLAVGAGAPAGESFFVCLAGVALAMTAGFLVVVAPSGIGVREAVLVAALAPVLSTSEALSVALVVRLVFTLADLIGAAATLPVRLRPRVQTMTE